MKPILYEKTETAFTSNGLGRLQDTIEATVVEERNSVYELDFTYPVDGERFDDIVPGRIIGVTHDETGDIQPFDIVSYSKPISGIVTFHCEHISYRQSRLTVSGTNINSLADAFTMLEGAEPENPFSYSTDKTSSGYMAAADGVPRSVRQMLGGIEGSILDAYGGEYEWNKFNVILHEHRGQVRDFTIRYGVNLLDYNEDADYSGTFTSCIPYWKGNDNGQDIVVQGNRVDSGASSYNGRNDCRPLDLSEKFEDAPTTAQLEAAAASYMQSNQTYLPAQNIRVDFVRLQDLGYEGLDDLLQCKLCDTIRVAFPKYNMTGAFKIVRTVWDVLAGRYIEMELGALSTTLAEALGITNSLGDSRGDFMTGDGVVYDDYDFTVTYSGGTVGTRGYEGTASGAKSGYYPIAATVIKGNTYYNIFNARVATDGTVTLSAFRATTGARSGDDVTVRVAYLKA